MDPVAPVAPVDPFVPFVPLDPVAPVAPSNTNDICTVFPLPVNDGSVIEDEAVNVITLLVPADPIDDAVIVAVDVAPDEVLTIVNNSF